MGGLASLLKYLPMILPIAIEAINLVEKIFGAGEGPAKLAAVVSLVKVAVMAAEGITEKDIVDDELFSEGVEELVSGIVKVLNSTGKFGGEEDPA